MDDRIASDLSLNRIQEVPSDTDPLLVSPLGFALKHDGTWRKIQHLSYLKNSRDSVNDQIPDEAATLQYVTFGRLLAMVLEAGRDSAHQRWHLGFQWKGKFYIDNLPEFKRAYDELGAICGVPENKKKREEGTAVNLLGLLVDTHTFTVSVLLEKLQRVLHLTQIAIDDRSLTLREAQSLTGLLSFCSPAVQLGYVFCRRLWTFIASFNPKWQQTLKRRVLRLMIEDIKWWNKLFPLYNGVRFFNDAWRPTIHLFEDASILGLRAFYFDHVQHQHCDWKEHVPTLQIDHAYAEDLPNNLAPQFDINIYEIQAVFRSVQIWGHKWKQKKLVVYTDNTTTQLGVKKLTLKSPEQNEPLRSLLLLAAQLDLLIEAVHLPGIDNELADALSRNKVELVANICP
ncbi:uncharacterized protein L3040_001011 [Drepanopeziza brunnea f. sp. 'multigermtubi']|uniref:uncharacterized protein n=1 Tax=Drepanopeziza brunnea f. sp. 'multigermtubi' TaxID=698441 RepID=UPI00238DB510|nr:hypothetical protein L3040_001011 [Drepanopeziza brunnea f. sp. 'multigermtubi']